MLQYTVRRQHTASVRFCNNVTLCKKKNSYRLNKIFNLKKIITRNK